MSRNLLFHKADWHSVQEAQNQRLKAEVAGLDSNRVLGTPIEDLIAYIDAKYRLEVPQLDKDSMVVDQQEKEIDVSHERERHWSSSGPHYVKGTEITLTILFTGDAGLFNVQPTAYTLSPPCGEIVRGQLVLRINGTRLDPKKVRAELDHTISQIESYLTNLKANVDAFNQQLKQSAHQHLEGRRHKLLNDLNLVGELGFPLKKRQDVPQTFVAPEIRRRIRPSLPPQNSAPFKPEPALAPDDYEHIIEILGNMALVMERSPSSFLEMDEESLRTHFLVHLNGHYEGQATGETFNCSGKTDILVRVEGKNIFIGECKYWGGPKKLLETLDQLLSYSSWRDTKVALLIFNRRKSFTTVVDAITPTVEGHPNFKRSLPMAGETRFRFVLSHKDDPAREMIVTVLVFDVPSADDNPHEPSHGIQ